MTAMDYVHDAAGPDPLYLFRLAHAESDIAALQERTEDLPALREGIKRIDERLGKLTAALWSAAASLLLFALGVVLTLR